MPDSNKPLRQLLPAPYASQPPPSRPNPPATRRRPTSTKVACNGCRSKKKACDGKRPSCGSCIELNLQCVYFSVDEKETNSMALKRENEALKRKTQAFEALFEQLSSMPPETIGYTLKSLKFATDPHAALRSIRPSDGLTDVREFMPHLHTNVEFELMRRHPVAYPLVRKASHLGSMQDTDTRPSKMPRISEVYDSSPSSSSSPEPAIAAGNAPTTAAPADFLSTSIQTTEPSAFGPPSGAMPPTYTDPRLKDLDIGFWTAVPITSDVAASVITMYLETDHAIMGLLDADLFIHDLTHYQFRYCSPFLVSAMLSFACQSYASYHPSASTWSQELQTEANNIWRVEKEDSLTSVAALAFMIQSVGCNGDGELDVQYIQDTAAMARRLKLYGSPDACNLADLNTLSEEDARAKAQVAWGIFCSLSMVAQFYLPATTEYPPAVPIPGRRSRTESEPGRREGGAEVVPGSNALPRSRRKRDGPASTSETFAAFCELWVISSRITWFYQHGTVSGGVSRAFALKNYNRLLGWAADLSESMARGEHSPDHVLTCHMFFHGTVLYLVRPFIPIEKQHGIKNWSPSAPGFQAIFAASLEQLKDLVEVYLTSPTAMDSIFWHTALMHVANAAANDTSDPEWRYIFLRCIYAYLGLYRSFTVAGVIARGLLAMAVRKGALGTTEGYALLQELRAKKSQKLLEGATGLFVTDLDLAVTDREAARVDRLIKEFEELTVLEEFTIGLT